MKLKLALILILTAISGTARASIITLDGRFDGAPPYSSSETVSWYNGHKTEYSIYGDIDTQLGTTTIHYGVAKLVGEVSGPDYFFVYIEVPLYAKNMIWEDKGKDGWKDDFPVSNLNPLVGLTEADVSSYRTHHESHHDPGDLKLDFKGATESEKLVLGNPVTDKKGKKKLDKQFEADLAGDADSAFGLIAFKDSVDYLLDNSLATEELSLARDTTMSFEFQFTLDTDENDAFLALIFENGIEFHLSPERGLAPTTSEVIPEPSTFIIFAGLALCFGIAGWRKKRRMQTT